jgi:hypothetical protein
VTGDKRVLIGCGILKKEIMHLVEKNHWDIDTDFLEPSLHINYQKLAGQLTAALNRHPDKERIVFYGECHPLMDRMLSDAGARRTQCQNCVDALLGTDLFMRELQEGAFFLLENWAVHWNKVVLDTFGQNLEVAKEIFTMDRKYLLCITTPCSGDFRLAAENAGRQMDVPVRWMHVSLEHLETVLKEIIAQENRKI